MRRSYESKMKKLKTLEKKKHCDDGGDTNESFTDPNDANVVSYLWLDFPRDTQNRQNARNLYLLLVQYHIQREFVTVAYPGRGRKAKTKDFFKIFFAHHLWKGTLVFKISSKGNEPIQIHNIPHKF